MVNHLEEPLCAEIPWNGPEDARAQARGWETQQGRWRRGVESDSAAHPETLRTTVSDKHHLWKDDERDHENCLRDKWVEVKRHLWKGDERDRENCLRDKWVEVKHHLWKGDECDHEHRLRDKWVEDKRHLWKDGRAWPWKPSKGQESTRAEESSVYPAMLRKGLFLRLQTTPAHGQGYTTNTPEPGTPLSRASIWPWLLKLAAILWGFKMNLHSPLKKNYLFLSVLGCAAFSSCGEWGLLSSRRASHCASFPFAEHGL